FSTVAWRCRLPFAHAAALPCLAIGYLTAYHLLTGGLDVARAEMGQRLLAAALTPTSGAALTVLAVLLAASAEAMIRLNRRLDGIFHAVGAGIVAALSLALVARDGLDNPGRAAIVWGALALAGLLANTRWRQS